jgi:hypothetical protein
MSALVGILLPQLFRARLQEEGNFALQMCPRLRDSREALCLVGLA